MKHVLLAFALIAGMIQPAQATVVGVTATNLVTIDPEHPSNVTIIGPHNLPVGIVPFNSLTYDPLSRKIFGLGRGINGASVGQYLIEYNLQTGTAATPTLVDTDPPVNFEALEFDNALGFLVASRTTNPSLSDTSELRRMKADGTTTLLQSTPSDNDFAVYDSIRNIFYTSDPNGISNGFSNGLFRVDLSNSWSFVDSVPLDIDEAAYSKDEDVIYALSETAHGHFYTLRLSNGEGPLQSTLIGSLGDDPILGIAVVPNGSSVVAVPTLTQWGFGLLIAALVCAGLLKARTIGRGRPLLR